MAASLNKQEIHLVRGSHGGAILRDVTPVISWMLTDVSDGRTASIFSLLITWLKGSRYLLG
jgi:hypothetical protein